MSAAGKRAQGDLSGRELEAMCAADLCDCYEKWIEWLRVERRVSRHTLRAYRADMLTFLSFLARHHEQKIGVSALSGASVSDFRAWLSRRAMDGASASTRARGLSGVKNFLKWLDRQGVAHNASIAVMRTPKIPRRLPRPLHISQAFDTLMPVREDWTGQRDRALFTLLWGAGLRIQEALDLNLEDLAGEDFLTVRGKGGRERQVPVLKIVRMEIDALRAACPFAEEPGRPLFLGVRGKRLHQCAAQESMRMIRKTMRLPETATPHALRHSFATHLLRGGANIREIQELLGHASLSSTQIYTEIENAELIETYNKAQLHKREAAKFTATNPD